MHACVHVGSWSVSHVKYSCTDLLPVYYSTVEEENTDESSAVEPEQHDDTGKDEQPMEQSDNVGDSTVSTGEAPDSSMFDNCNFLMNRTNLCTV